MRVPSHVTPATLATLCSFARCPSLILDIDENDDRYDSDDGVSLLTNESILLLQSLTLTHLSLANRHELGDEAIKNLTHVTSHTHNGQQHTFIHSVSSPSDVETNSADQQSPATTYNTPTTSINPSLGCRRPLSMLTSLKLTNMLGLTPRGISFLSALTRLTHLDLGECVSIDDIAPLSGLTSLMWLNLEQCPISDAQLVHLTPLTRLRSLNLGFCHLTDQATSPSLSHLSHLPLTSLDLSSNSLRSLHSLLRVTGLVSDLPQSHALPSHSVPASLPSSPYDPDSQLSSQPRQFMFASLRVEEARRTQRDPDEVDLQRTADERVRTTLHKHMVDLRAKINPRRFLSVPHTLTFLDLTLSDVRDLSPLARLSSLQELILRGCVRVTDMWLGYLSQLSQLTSLDVYGCSRLTSACLVHLVSLPLRSLHLGRCPLLGTLGEKLGKVPPLHSLSLLTTLTRLNLSHCGIADEALRHLKGLPLRFLRLSHCPITDRSLVCLASWASMSGLLYLSLNGCAGITAEGVRQLRQLASLKHVVLGGCFASLTS